MQLNEIFLKPVDRYIEGVIKANDDAGLKRELEEYVLTNEVSKRLEAFLDSYNNYEGANGAWISGFFGSGKSHLLKMLAMLLENRQIDGQAALDYFLPKCGDNEFLKATLKRAAAIPSRSILFNIDQKAIVIAKTQIDALLTGFVRVFDNMCGYYGSVGYIAQMERDLDKRGLYQNFKNKIQELSGIEWTKIRDLGIIEGNNISAAFAAVTGNSNESVSGILNKYRDDYKVSIEDFADNVNDYVMQRGKDFRLNFLVDEVGQYIADNVKLMTNLQTIAETLATKCKGRAWLIVTAQEEMDSVLGEMSQQKKNDFSKIQARFKNRLKLTSADVAEVIQKRLLSKTSAGKQALADLYNEQVNNFKTLFDFTDGSQTYRNFKQMDHFIDSYPFIPYQYTLFQSAIQNLSAHNALEGRHSSVGERSMLGVFQTVSIHIETHEVGQLATFDLMFEGIRTVLKSQIQQAVIKAEKNLPNPFTAKILKALFLVKYIQEFKATVRNICVLMTDGFNRDMAKLKKNVEEALQLLEKETYIQRSGDVYEFLTNEEKDVEQEIKNTTVEPDALADELANIIFDKVIKTRKIRYDDNNQDYIFARKLDDRLMGRDYELKIHVISPFHADHDTKSKKLILASINPDELRVIMPQDRRLMDDLYMYKRTEKYIRQKTQSQLQDKISAILSDKRQKNAERGKGMETTIRALLGKAQLALKGDVLENATAKDPQLRINWGFARLIARVYPNLKMIKEGKYSEKLIADHLENSGGLLYDDDRNAITEAELNVLNIMNHNKERGIRTTLKSLVDKLESKPNGWYLEAIQCILATLSARGKIEFQSESNILEGIHLEQALKNTKGFSNIQLQPQIQFSASQVRRLKDFYQQYFDKPPASNDAKALAMETMMTFKDAVHELEILLIESKDYPFNSRLQQPLQNIKALTGKHYKFYLTDLTKSDDDLLDVKEALLDPVKRFMTGSQRKIFDETKQFIQDQQYNVSYVEGNEYNVIIDILSDEVCFQNNHMQNAKIHTRNLEEMLNRQLAVEKNEAMAIVAAKREQITGMEEFSALSQTRKEKLEKEFSGVNKDIESQELIAVIRDKTRRFQEHGFQQLLTLIHQWSAPKPQAAGDSPKGREEGQDEKPQKPVEYVAGQSIRVSFQKPWLDSEADVDRYLAAFKEALIKEIEMGKRVQV
jgi:hypothetical protein